MLVFNIVSKLINDSGGLKLSETGRDGGRHISANLITKLIEIVSWS